MERETYPNPRVVDLAKKFVPVKLNTDVSANVATARRYGVQAIPTIVFADASGKPVREFVGWKSPDDILKEMQAALKKAKR